MCTASHRLITSEQVGDRESLSGVASGVVRELLASFVRCMIAHTKNSFLHSAFYEVLFR
jgi:hypothetical protein